MKYITIIGDSHAEGISSGLSEFARINNVDIKTEFVKYHGGYAYKVDYSNINTADLYGHTLLFHFGENDCRRKLPKYKNAEETAKTYIQKTLEHFKDNRLIFIQPVPQALNELTHEFQFSPKEFNPLEKRIEQQRIFNKTISEYKGIEYISMQDVFGIEVATAEYLADGCHLNRENEILLAGYIINYINKAVD